MPMTAKATTASIMASSVVMRGAGVGSGSIGPAGDTAGPTVR